MKRFVFVYRVCNIQDRALYIINIQTHLAVLIIFFMKLNYYHIWYHISRFR